MKDKKIKHSYEFSIHSYDIETDKADKIDMLAVAQFLHEHKYFISSPIGSGKWHLNAELETLIPFNTNFTIDYFINQEKMITFSHEIILVPQKTELVTKYY